MTKDERQKIYRSEHFSLTRAVVDLIAAMRDECARRRPDDPMVLAGVSLPYSPDRLRTPQESVIVGVWCRSQVSQEIWDSPDIVELAGFHILFDVPAEHRAAFSGRVIDFTSDAGCVLRALPPR